MRCLRDRCERDGICQFEKTAFEAEPLQTLRQGKRQRWDEFQGSYVRESGCLYLGL